MRHYAIGDIHGQLGKLQDAHDRIAQDRARTGDMSAPVVHLGDLVDRGPDSRSVIEFLVTGITSGEPWIVIKGNHDSIFEAQLDSEAQPTMPFRSWCSDTMGGVETVLSYSVSPPSWTNANRTRRALSEAVPASHREFLSGLPLFHETPDLLFVHAGIRPGLPLSEQHDEELMWIRGDFLTDTRDHGKLVVHGHTPIDKPMHCGNRINLDTGAGYGRDLTAAVFEGRDCFILESEGRRPLLSPK